MANSLIKNKTKKTMKIDPITGEVLETEETEENSVIRFKGEEPPFVKLYLNTVLMLNNIPITQNDILNEILILAPFADKNQKFSMSKEIKMDIAKKTGKALGTVNNTIQKFRERNILISEGRNTYRINPYFFGKGDWTNIKSIRSEIQYEEGVVKINTTTQNAEEVNQKENNVKQLHAEDELGLRELNKEKEEILI